MIASPRAAPQRGPGWIPGGRHAWPRPDPPSSPGHLWIRGQLTPHNPRRLSPCVDRPVDNYTLVFPHLCPQMWMNHRGVLSGLSFMTARAARCISCVVSSLLRHVGVMPSETLAWTGPRDRLVVLEVTMSRGEEAWQVVGVQGADIKGAPDPHAEEEPQDSNDPRWEH